jgi:DNA adenine methylase Dam
MIKNPFNYIGGKFKLLEQLSPYFPKKIDTFYDIFGGGGDISFNLNYMGINYNKINFYDKNRQLINIFYWLQKKGDNFISDIETVIKNYNLSKTNKENYIKLRTYYNNFLLNDNGYENAVVLYTLMCFSFNNFINFNKKDEFNVPFGMNRSSFNSSLKKKLNDYILELKNNNINFYYKDFSNLNLSEITKNDFIYLDPPYYITTGAYERNAKTKWNIGYEKKLYEFIKKLDDNNIKFLLSNVIEHKGKENFILKKFIKEKNFTLKILNCNYKNCNYQSHNDKNITKEIILFN